MCVGVCVSDSNLWLWLQRLQAKHWGDWLMVEGGNEAARPKLRGGGSSEGKGGRRGPGLGGVAQGLGRGPEGWGCGPRGKELRYFEERWRKEKETEEKCGDMEARRVRSGAALGSWRSSGWKTNDIHNWLDLSTAGPNPNSREESGWDTHTHTHKYPTHTSLRDGIA